MFTRVRNEEGFGLIELMMAMTVLNIGILAIVAAFNSGIFAIKRSSMISTASALADQQMELYRGVQYAAIALDTTSLSTAVASAAPYTTDTAYSLSQVTTTCAQLIDQCVASREVTGAVSPDHHAYRVDTYIVMSTPSTTPPTPTGGRPLKIVTIVVRDKLKLTARPLARVTSTFDQSTG